MLKKIVCIAISFILATSFFISSFIVNADDLDFLETHTVPAPTVPSDGNLLSNDELVTEFNEDYYNEDHLVEDETEAGEMFDEKAEFHTTEDISGLPNSSKSTNEDLRWPSFNSANSTKVTEISQQLVKNGIMTIADDFVITVPSSITKFAGSNHNRHGVIDNPKNLIGVLKGNIAGDYDISYSLYYNYIRNNYYYSEYPSYEDFMLQDWIDIDHLVVYTHTAFPDSPNNRHTEYGFIICDTDIYFDTSRGFYDSNVSGQSNVVYCDCFGGYVKDGEFLGYSLNSLSCSINGKGEKSSYITQFSDFSPVYIGKKIDVYINEEKQEKHNEDGTLVGDIYGEFGFKEDSKILTYKAWSDKELDKTYDVHLWALDSSGVPDKINGNEDFPIRDLDNYVSHGLQLSASKSSVQASYELEAVYYYLHHMKGYDDSLESVDGYDFDEFEKRESLYFAIAYREKGSSGDWIVCKYYLYNYHDLIENVMDDFTAKKDYVDFPDLSDYVEGFPSIDDFLPDDDDPGPIDWILAFIKWIGNCVYIGFKNFLGFFSWLGDCIPILWENLTIALYNLVCDLKELALYFFKPKTKSIYAIACERIPALTSLFNFINNPSSSDTPSLTFFGTNISVDFPSYFDVSYARSILSLLYVAVFAASVFKLLMKVFSFNSGGDDK